MEEKIKEIISVFTKIPVGEIGPGTPIGRSAVKSSILLHRMYAKLSEEGLVVENYAAVRVFGDLVAQGRSVGNDGVLGKDGMVGNDGNLGNAGKVGGVNNALTGLVVGDESVSDQGAGIGIDIEEVAAMPKVDDYRREEFYLMNFTAGEIAYCILQPDPTASFAGLFAAKEAIVKADGRYRSKPFNTIVIGHTEEGRPGHTGFNLSISHAGGMAVAVAVRAGAGAAIGSVPAVVGAGRAEEKVSSAGWPAWLALLVAIVAIIIHFIR